MQSTVAYKPNTSQSTTYTTSYAYNASGALASAYVGDGRPRSVTVTNDALGQAIRRDEADNNTNATTGGDPHEVWYRFNGRQLGYVGNNGTEDLDYASSLARRTAAAPSGTQGAFRGGASYGGAYADFDQNYAPINSYEQGSAGGSYTVRTGDSLASIAAQLWGDAGLWYKLAAANGLSGDSALAAGQTLTVPGGVSKSGNNATTFKPYDVTDAYGDTSPTTPQPQAAAKKNKCGVFGQILIAVITVGVALALPGGGQFAGALLNATIGNLAGQVVGLATGIQQKFDFKGLAIAAISAGVTFGVGEVVQGAVAGSKVLGDVIRGVASSAITQGVGVATGLQPKFDWAGVAAAGISAGVGGAASRGLTRQLTGPADAHGVFRSLTRLEGYGVQLAGGVAGGIASAAARSVATGTDFGDNILAVLPDVVAQTLGRVAADAVTAEPGSNDLQHMHPDEGEAPITRPDLNLIDQLNLPGSSDGLSDPTHSSFNYDSNTFKLDTSLSGFQFASRNSVSSLQKWVNNPEWLTSFPNREDWVFVRSQIYSSLDQAVNSAGSVYNTDFFGAASTTTGITGLTGGQFLSYLTQFPTTEPTINTPNFDIGYPYTRGALQNIQTLGADLWQKINVPLFRALYNGDDSYTLLSGQTLGEVGRRDVKSLNYALVHNEQTFVQNFLNALPADQRQAIVTQSTGVLRGSLTSGTIKTTIKSLGHPFDFARQSDREAIGRAEVDQPSFYGNRRRVYSVGSK